MKLKHVLIFSAIVLLAAGCGNKKEVVKEEKRVEKVMTTVLSKQIITRQIELSSTLEGYETMEVSPSVTGIIEHIYAEVGDRVKKGDTLVRMDQNQYIKTKLAFANLKIEMNRMKLLLESEAVSQQVYDQTKLSYDQTEASLEFLEENTFIKAQFDGVVSAKNYEDGELYGGKPILSLKQIRTLKALVNIPESFFPLVKKGMKVDVASDIYSGRTFPAVIEVVYPTIDPASHTFSVKLRIPNGSELLRPGMYVKTNLDMGQKEVMVVPYKAVQRLIGSNKRFVYLNRDGKAKRVFVEIGERHDQLIEIVGDEVKAGDELVTAGQDRLVDGIKLDVVKR